MKLASNAIMSETGLADLLAAPGQPSIYLDGLAETYKTQVGWDMMTLLVFDLKRRVGRRIYTTDAVNYPVSTEKPMLDSDWTERVLKRHEIFIANRYEEFRPHFVDWEKLRGMGMELAINYPIVVDGEALGTVNLTAARGFYSPDRVDAGKSLSPLAALGFFLLARPRADREQRA